MLRYEDFALNPIALTKHIYDYFQIDPHGLHHVLNYLEGNTRAAHDGDRWGTARNSTQVATNWMESMSWQAVDQIQRACGQDVMNWLGYSMVKNAF